MSKFPVKCTIVLSFKDEPGHSEEEQEVLQVPDVTIGGYVIDSHLINLDGEHKVFHEIVDESGVHDLVSSDNVLYDVEDLNIMHRQNMRG